jgi:hypothetical protein
MNPRQRWMRLSGAGLGVLLLCTYGYFFTGSGPNQNTRYDLVRAVVEEGRMAIDSYHENTIDKASGQGHYYSDKAPGSSVAALPVYAAAYGTARLWSPAEWIRRDLRTQERLLQLVQLFCAALPGALLGVSVLLFLLQWTAPRVHLGWTLIAALAVALGTPLFAYSTMFYGHVLSALGLFVGYQLLFRATEESPGRTALLAAGACFGFATLAEYTAAPAAAILLAVRAWPSRGVPLRSTVREAGRLAGWIAAGGIPFALLFAANNRLVTGSWLQIGYANVQEQFQGYQRVGFYGVGLPSPAVLFELLLGRMRGLWLLSPILLCALAGIPAAWRRSRRVTLAAGAVIAYYLLLNASYAAWWGGASTYPRHLTAAAPFFAPFVYFALISPRAWVRLATRIAAALSILNGLVIVAVDPQVVKSVAFPLASVYRALLRGELGAALWWTPSLNGAARALSKGTNLGMYLTGATNLWSLLPLLAFWIAAVLVLRSRLRRAGVPLWTEFDPGALPTVGAPEARRRRGQDAGARRRGRRRRP